MRRQPAFAGAVGAMLLAGACGGTVSSGDTRGATAREDGGRGGAQTSPPVESPARADAGSPPAAPSGSAAEAGPPPEAPATFAWWEVPGCVVVSQMPGEHGACEIPLDRWTEDAETLELTNVDLFVPGDVDGGDPERSVRPLYVGAPERCAEHGLGWYVDDRSVPRRIVACPSVCERVQGTPWSALVVLTGCGRQGLPGEEPTPLPEPVCPPGRQQSCTGATGGVGWVAPKCTGLGDDSLAAWDPLLTNVVVVAEATVARGGYVPYLGSARECARVGDGWYYEEGTSPPQVSVCPATCACLRSTPGAHFMVESGCRRVEE